MKKLVLFDIDGTLIRSVSGHKTLRRLPFAIQAVFGKTVTIPENNWPYNGLTECAILWELIRPLGISKTEFLRSLPKIAKEERVYLENLAESDGTLFTPIEDARTLIGMLKDTDTICLGILSGNLQQIGEWKLGHTGLASYFPFSAYGDKVFDRVHIVRGLLSRAENYFQTNFSGDNIICIGDTSYDIFTGKALGGHTIGVTTAYDSDEIPLKNAKPDIFVHSLMNQQVLDLFHLQKH